MNLHDSEESSSVGSSHKLGQESKMMGAEEEKEEKEKEKEGDLKIKTALLSTFDKTGLIEFARKLLGHGVSLIATGGTLASLEKAGIVATPLDRIGHFPEMLDGRVKTLQPEIFAGILARKTNQDHMRQIAEKGIKTIDMVVCNFYAFEAT